MAASAKVYGKAGTHLAQRDVNWASDAYKLALCTSAYAVSQGVDEYFDDLTNEIAAGGGYSAGGFALAGKAITYDSTTREERFTADPISVAALTPASPFRYGVVYRDTGTPGTSFLVMYINFGADQDPAGLPFAIQWPGTGIWYTLAV